MILRVTPAVSSSLFEFHSPLSFLNRYLLIKITSPLTVFIFFFLNDPAPPELSPFPPPAPLPISRRFFDVFPLPQRRGNVTRARRGRLPGERNLADQREHDRAPLGDARFRGEIRILEHRYAYAV